LNRLLKKPERIASISHPILLLYTLGCHPAQFLNINIIRNPYPSEKDFDKNSIFSETLPGDELIIRSKSIRLADPDIDILSSGATVIRFVAF